MVNVQFIKSLFFTLSLCPYKYVIPLTIKKKKKKEKRKEKKEIEYSPGGEGLRNAAVGKFPHQAELIAFHRGALAKRRQSWL